jgi:glycosyltransferase involved in cell wall biosynthesis
VRIAFVITRADTIGGPQVHVRDLCSALTKRAHEVTVLVGGEGPFTAELHKHSIRFASLRHLVRPISIYRDIAALTEMSRALRRFQPDIISSHSSKAGWIARVVGRRLGIPTIFTAHGWSFTHGVPLLQRLLYMSIDRITVPLASHCICVSDYERCMALRYRVTRSDRLSTVYNGVPDVDYSLRARPDAEPVRLIMVARMDPPKDCETLLRSLALLAAESWDLDLVGDGILRPAVEALASQLGLSRRIRFLGRRTDVSQLLAAAQVFVLVSRFEAFPRSILEAMRAGLPVLASDVGGVRESLVDGETGFLVKPGDVTDLARKLEQLIRNPCLRMRMGAAGRRHYETNFTFETMLAQTMRIFQAVTSK